MGDSLVELKLGGDARPSEGADELLLGLIDRMLSLISDVAVGNEHLKTTPEFREQLNGFRKAVCRRDFDGDSSLGETADVCLKACENFFSHAREHALNREIEFIEIIDVLRETVRKLAGQSEEFGRSMIGSSERLRSLLEIDDIQSLKERIRVETDDLSRIVAEKQTADRESYSHLLSRVENLQSQLERAEEEATMDPLTQVANRGSFDKAIEGWVESDDKFSLAMVDLDDFKKINDTYGHPVGDRVLLGAAQALGKSIRSGDMVARYGGEEFVVLLRNCDLVMAEARLSQILEDLANTRYEYGSGPEKCHIQFTASCGLAVFDSGESVDDIVQRSDQALYEAKKRGKNRVVVKKKSLLKGLFGRRSAA